MVMDLKDELSNYERELGAISLKEKRK